MAIRTTATTVGGIIEVDSNVSVSPMIDVANELVDKVATNDTNGVMTVGMLRHLETYLAAYFYAIRCQQYKEKKTGDASASFQIGESGKGCFDANDWGRTAMMLDLTGYLRKLNNGIVNVGLDWLGLPPSSQTDYVDRD